MLIKPVGGGAWLKPPGAFGTPERGITLFPELSQVRIADKTAMRIHPLLSVGQPAKYLLIGLVLLCAADWGQFAVRSLLGSGFGSVKVEQYLKTSLKGGKAEYDYMGMINESCSRSLFPQYAASQWNPPCWWLGRHRQQWH